MQHYQQLQASGALRGGLRLRVPKVTNGSRPCLCHALTSHSSSTLPTIRQSAPAFVQLEMHRAQLIKHLKLAEDAPGHTQLIEEGNTVTLFNLMELRTQAEAGQEISTGGYVSSNPGYLQREGVWRAALHHAEIAAGHAAAATVKATSLASSNGATTATSLAAMSFTAATNTISALRQNARGHTLTAIHNIHGEPLSMCDVMELISEGRCVTCHQQDCTDGGSYGAGLRMQCNPDALGHAGEYLPGAWRHNMPQMHAPMVVVPMVAATAPRAVLQLATVAA